MEALLQNIEWVPTLVSFGLAFLLGWLWYSPLLFLKPWAAASGINLDGDKSGMLKPMVFQVLGTFLLAVITNMAVADGHGVHAIVVALTIACFVMASNLYKTPATCVGARVEVGYILTMAFLMLGVNAIF